MTPGMSAFHVYVESPVDRTPAGIERLAVAISKKYGLPIPDLVKRMTAGRFRVKANVDAATADAYARALEEVGARVKVEEVRPTAPSLPVIPAEAAAKPAAPPVAAEPRKKAPTMPGDKPSRGGRYSVSPPASSSRTAVPGARSKTPSAEQRLPAASSGPPREAHERSQLMPPSRASAPSLPPATVKPPVDEIDPFGDLELSAPTGTGRAATSSLPPANAPRPATSSLPPANAPRPATSSLPPVNASPPANVPRASNPAYQSGLSAAYSKQIPVPSDLGALGEDALSLSSLDGVDASGGDSSFVAPSPGMPASIGPPPEPASPVKFASKPNSAPVVARPATPVPFDMFAPPDAEEAEQIVNLAPSEARPEPKPAQTPALGVPKTLRKPPVQGVTMGGVAVPETPRSRIIAGVVLAILIGFLPAHLIASIRETSAFQKIDDQITATQAAADTPEMYATLDAFRAAQLDRKESERRSIALTSMLIWAVVAAGVGYLWFRRIPWDRTPR